MAIHTWRAPGAPRAPAPALVFAVLALVAATAALSGCGRTRDELPPADADAGYVEPEPWFAAPICSSATMQDPNYQPSELMAPGRACIACHVEENAANGEEDAPPFAFAGTVYPTAHEPDFCVGSGGRHVVVEVTDARGMTFKTVANEVGNFFEEIPGFRPPYTAKIHFAGRTRVMEREQMDGDCNGCHTQVGRELAPGRILRP